MFTVSNASAVMCLDTLGYGRVASFCGKATNYTLPSRMRRNFDFGSLLPGVLKGLQCLGSEDSAGQCLLETAIESLQTFKGLPPGTTRQLNNVAWVSCKRMTCVFIGLVLGVLLVCVFHEQTWGFYSYCFRYIFNGVKIGKQLCNLYLY